MCLRLNTRATIGLTAIALTSASCGSRGELAFAPEAASVGSVETVLVSTTRAPVEGLPLYTRERADQPQFARFQISVPPDRKLGTVTYPRRSPPDPRTDFLVVAAQRLPDERAFIAGIDAMLAAEPPDRRSAIIFIHGYNTTFAEGLYRHAQLQHDLEPRGVSIHFAWPSAASSRGYLHDRESALFSRDALATTIDALARSNAAEFNLAGHSMGAFLLMDTLRTMALVGHDEVFRKLNTVLLISPDIEIDVFRKQAEPVLARGVRIYVLVSGSDRALRLSARLRGERERLGSIRSAGDLGGLDVGVVDLSAVKSVDMLGHFKSGTSPAIIDFVRRLRASGLEVFDQGGQPGLIETSVSVVQEGTDILVAPLATR